MIIPKKDDKVKEWHSNRKGVITAEHGRWVFVDWGGSTGWTQRKTLVRLQEGDGQA